MIPKAGSGRYHGFDSLRAVMMLLGVVFHGAIPYMAAPDVPWPYKDPQSNRLLDLIVVLIHIFRMPVFFVMAGFFAALLYHERGESYFIRNRAKRILLPFVLSWPVLFLASVAGFWYAQVQTGQQTQSSFGALCLTFLRNNRWLHLWFLYDLLVLYAAALILARLPIAPAVYERFDRIFRRSLSSRFKALWLAPAVMVTLVRMRTGILDTTSSLLPMAPYVLFFTMGWFLYRVRDNLRAIEQGAWTHAVLGLALFPIAVRMVVRLRTGAFVSEARMHVAVAVAVGLVMALLALGVAGLFLRYLNSHNSVLRYLTDASYWIYLVHLPVTIWLSGIQVQHAFPAAVKFVNVEIGTMLLAVGSYQFLVRSTVVGELLNGKRRKPALVEAEGSLTF